MKPAAAFRATVHGLKTVPTRKVCQLTVEFPIEQLPEVAGIAEHGAWVAIARIDPEVAAARTPPIPQAAAKEGAAHPIAPAPLPRPKLAQTIGAICKDPRFHRFLQERYRTAFALVGNEPAQFVRVHCDVESRREIENNGPALEVWRALDSEFTAWRVAP